MKLPKESLLPQSNTYEQCQPGLGLEFSEEAHAAIERICEHPDAWMAIDPETRRCLTNRFPYSVTEKIFDKTIKKYQGNKALQKNSWVIFWDP
uniref:Uncharacterized protein n=1 Tax=Candidatus Kentrum sp. LPFa TaxID=2126335 RepID=A0A450WTI5_9GAMM|nr:MAG: hypothetical protein BECKLPF1236B_GA0070989_12076 [Candidatus Kentron sp. LPFa]